MNEHKKWLTAVKSTPPQDAENIVEMATMDLEYHVTFVAEAAVVFHGVDSNLKTSPVHKMLSNSIPGLGDIVPKRSSRWMWQTLLLSSFKKLLQTT